MIVPFHTDKCREGWGCHKDCPVRYMAEQYEALLQAKETTQ